MRGIKNRGRRLGYLKRWFLYGGVSSASLTLGAYMAPGQEVTSYTYDALGRLAGSSIAGGPNSSVQTKTCFDPSGNRLRYEVATSAPSACAAPTPTPTPGPTPTPNQAPIAVADSEVVDCFSTVFVNVLANDSDPDGHVPLVMVSIVKTNSGNSAASVSGNLVQIVAGGTSKKLTSFTYTMRDALGATATATLTVFAEGDSCV